MTTKDKEKQEEYKKQQEAQADEKSKDTEGNTDISSGNDKDGPTEEKDISAEEQLEDQQDEKGTDQQPTDPKDMMIKELENRNNELNDKYLRLFSDFDNFRKRNIKERLELTKTASAEITEAVLPVLDDLERAYKSATENPDIEALTEGLNLITTKLKTTLKHKGLEEIPTLGEEFNTDFHEAITNIPAKEEQDKGKVIDEVQKGYMLNGKVLRFAKVVVAN